MVLAARAAGISFSTASMTPQRMPMSRFPRSDWLGSSTSPPLITRSNLSFGPIAALAKRPDSIAAAAEPDSARKLRRDNADMLASPPKSLFLCGDDEANTTIAQAGRFLSDQLCNFRRRALEGKRVEKLTSPEQLPVDHAQCGLVADGFPSCKNFLDLIAHQADSPLRRQQKYWGSLEADR